MSSPLVAPPSGHGSDSNNNNNSNSSSSSNSNNNNNESDGNSNNNTNNGPDPNTISAMENGRFRLPTVLIQYEDGSIQNLTIEVGPRNSRSRNNISDSLEAFYSALQNAPVPPDYISDLRNRIENTPSLMGLQNSNTVTNSTSSTSSTANAHTDTPQREGVRGIDYPAFDVSSDGVYREPSNPTSAAPAEASLSSDATATATSSTSAITPASSSTPNTTSSFSSGEFLRQFLLPFQRSFDRSRSNTVGNSSRTHNTTSTITPNTAPSSSEAVDETRTSRNIILTVNYIYSQGEIAQANALNDTNNNDNNNMSGSLILNVPNIAGGDNESLQVLIRLATTIALRTIASSVKSTSGISQEAFNILGTKKLADLLPNERSCPICYDDYIEVESNDDDDEELENDEEEVEEEEEDKGSTQSKSLKRKRRHSDSREVKKVKVDSQNNSKGQSKAAEEEFTHVAVEMPCGHVFGRSCLYHWLKANNSCPLCRDNIKKQKIFQNLADDGNGNNNLDNNTNNEPISETTITLPNLASVINQGRENIEDFNSRNLTFFLNERNENNAPNTRVNNTNNDSNTVSTTNGTNGPPVSLLRENLNTLRNLIESVTRGNLAETAPARMRTLSNTLDGATRVPSPLSSSLLPRVAAASADDSNRPIVFDNSNPYRRRIFNRRNLTSTLINRDPLFPIGVESRRSANGVSTRYINGHPDSSSSSSELGESDTRSSDNSNGNSVGGNDEIDDNNDNNNDNNSNNS